MTKLFALADVLEFRQDAAETSGRYAKMSDAQLDLEAMKVARAEILSDANQAALDASQASIRMHRLLDRAQVLKGQIEVAELLLAVAHG